MGTPAHRNRSRCSRAAEPDCVSDWSVSGGGDGEAGIIRVGNLVAAGGSTVVASGMHTCVGDERHIALHHLQQVGEIHRT